MRNIVKVFEQFEIRFVEHPTGLYNFGIVAVDVNQISSEFPCEGVLSPIQFYRYVARSGNVELCIWADVTFAKLVSDEVYLSTFLPLFEIAIMATIASHNSYRSEEYRVEAWKKRIAEFLPNAKILSWNEVKKTRGIETQKTPDIVIDIDGDVIPVEAKIVPFTKKHLTQLKCYMKLLKTNKGIALAPSLKCELLPNIEYFQL